MTAEKIDPTRCRWIWRDDTWQLVDRDDTTVVYGTVRRQAVYMWMPFDRDGHRLAIHPTHPPNARALVEHHLDIRHVMISEDPEKGP